MMKRFRLFVILILVVFTSTSCSIGNMLKQTPQPPRTSFEAITGKWVVTGLFYEGKLVELSDYPSIANMFDAIILTVNEDGSFLYIDYIFSEGQCQPISSTEYKLIVSNRYKIEFVDDEINTVPIDSTPDKYYQITVVNNSAIDINAIDPETGGALDTFIPMQLTRQDSP